MAKTFKSLLGDDKTNTRTMLHEAIPITGTISSGTYNAAGTETNIKTFSHGMFESVYDYPYLSSSATLYVGFKEPRPEHWLGRRPRPTFNVWRLFIRDAIQIFTGRRLWITVYRFYCHR